MHFAAEVFRPDRLLLGTLRARPGFFRFFDSDLLVLLGLRLAASLALGLHFRLTLLLLLFACFLLQLLYEWLLSSFSHYLLLPAVHVGEAVEHRSKFFIFLHFVLVEDPAFQNSARSVERHFTGGFAALNESVAEFEADAAAE